MTTTYRLHVGGSVMATFDTEAEAIAEAKHYEPDYDDHNAPTVERFVVDGSYTSSQRVYPDAGPLYSA